MMSDAYTTRLMPQTDGSTAALFGPWLLKSAFQPIFDLRSGKAEIAGFEGLVRPFLSGRGASPATLFRPTQGPDRQLLETVTRDLHMMNAATLPVKNAMLFINLDPSAFSDRLAIAEALADGSLFASDNTRALALSTRSAQSDDALMAALERWEELGRPA